MLALGLIIIVLAALLITAIVTGTVHSFDIDLFGVDVATSNLGLFFSGVAVGVGVLVGFILIRAGLQRGRRRQREATAAASAADTAVPPPHPEPDSAEM